MCGIFGLVLKNDLKAKKTEIIKSLFMLSMSRGSEACGIAIREDEVIKCLKFPDSPKKLFSNKTFKEILSRPVKDEEDFVCLGHTRMVTHGSRGLNDNNQPAHSDGITVVHNGIICNYKDLWKKINKKPKSDLDTEVIPALINESLKNGLDKEAAIKSLYSEIVGDASIGVLFENENKMIVASNTGSAYFAVSKGGSFIFASEIGFLQKLKEKFPEIDTIGKIKQPELIKTITYNQPIQASFQEIGIQKKRLSISTLKRCTKCLLPETFPMISFDKDGVCNTCHNYITKKAMGLDALNRLCDEHRKNDGSPDCLLAFSGGRDSSYALHYLKQEMGMNPVTLTYDWGLVTDIARRNISRMCGQLGVENILVSADIPRKRKNVKLNLNAWLKQPDPGMVTLLMAGDKEFLYHPQRVSKELNLSLTFFASNSLEQTGFKSALCGVNESNNWYSFVSPIQKIKMLTYFLSRYISNPFYINSTIFDTLRAFYCAYIMKFDFKIFYDYLPWNESEIDETLARHYNWETEKNNASTWRIGDGTSAFYNYIYIRLLGFTENDAFRSNQIREGIISREEALHKLNEDNKIRYAAMQFYADTIGFSLPEVIERIESISNYH